MYACVLTTSCKLSGVAVIDDQHGRSAERLPALVWPLPLPTSRLTLRLPTSGTGTAATTLFGPASQLNTLLRDHAFETAWYTVPHGVAVLTNIEQINDSGQALAGPLRWESGPVFRLNSASAYIRALFGPSAGRFRAFLFIISDASPSYAPTELSPEVLNSIKTTGEDSVPAALSSMPLQDGHQIHCLVYEFRRTATDTPSLLLKTSEIRVKEHLRLAGLDALAP
ncbi:hypothetical protein D7W81_00950 [Corallococcus aberystwythensis]|uniref:Uncharacterized protein n=2 Tax=Corallococcus aberystwythensis TaxID=2316722 RepID=A0A3A8R152_9BACT|nr:hypothetical protein D7W81_00950 [Corallococcus aberystwythensis]